MTIVRDAVEADLPAVLEIYNGYLATTTAAWSEIPQTLEDRLAWYHERLEAGFPVLVAVDGDDHEEVVGFTSYGTFRGAGMWPGYRHTAELTVFVTERRCSGGVGRAISTAAAAPNPARISRVPRKNTPSLPVRKRRHGEATALSSTSWTST